MKYEIMGGSVAGFYWTKIIEELIDDQEEKGASKSHGRGKEKIRKSDRENNLQKQIFHIQGKFQ